MQPYIVYVKKDEYNRIVAVNSSAFIIDTDGWVEIDSGIGDKYHHAQNNYLDKPIYDDCGICRYKIVTFVDWPEGKILHEFFCNGEEYGIFERTQEELDADWAKPVPQPDPRDKKIAELEEQVAILSAAVLNI